MRRNLAAVSAMLALTTALSAPAAGDRSLGGAFPALVGETTEGVWAPTTTETSITRLQALQDRLSKHPGVSEARILTADMLVEAGEDVAADLLQSIGDGIAAADRLLAPQAPLQLRDGDQTLTVESIGGREASWQEWRRSLQQVLAMTPEQQQQWAEQVTTTDGRSFTVRAQPARQQPEQPNLLAQAESFHAFHGMQPLERARAHGLRLTHHISPAADGASALAPSGVSGPSAGLAYALSRLDSRLDGQLLGDLVIVATGSIRPDGRVGAVGGLPEKMRAAEALQADLMIVAAGSIPPGARTPDLPLVQVRDLTEAVAAICRQQPPPQPEAGQLCRRAEAESSWVDLAAVR